MSRIWRIALILLILVQISTSCYTSITTLRKLNLGACTSLFKNLNLRNKKIIFIFCSQKVFPLFVERGVRPRIERTRHYIVRAMNLHKYVHESWVWYLNLRNIYCIFFSTKFSTNKKKSWKIFNTIIILALTKENSVPTKINEFYHN